MLNKHFLVALLAVGTAMTTITINTPASYGNGSTKVQKIALDASKPDDALVILKELANIVIESAEDADRIYSGLKRMGIDLEGIPSKVRKLLETAETKDPNYETNETLRKYAEELEKNDYQELRRIAREAASRLRR